ncbi:MAG: YlmC/YmxH family sporulation protein [Bacilli bacterium]|nr:YlmC/YmxH family sporulation protein [Bacilli bacterium]
MNLSDFQNKDVINIKDGRRIGNIIDCKIDSITGEIKSFLLVPFKGVFSFKGNNKIEIDFKDIEKIGEDVILVNFKE